MRWHWGAQPKPSDVPDAAIPDITDKVQNALPVRPGQMPDVMNSDFFRRLMERFGQGGGQVHALQTAQQIPAPALASQLNG